MMSCQSPDDTTIYIQLTANKHLTQVMTEALIFVPELCVEGKTCTGRFNTFTKTSLAWTHYFSVCLYILLFSIYYGTDLLEVHQ